MTFQPAVPFGGIAGLRFLERTSENQLDAFQSSPEIQRNITYFAENIANVKSADELLDDRRLTIVALGAFGLGDDINKRAFVQKILEGGTDDPSSLANRLSDQRYTAITEAFRFDRVGFPRTNLPSVRDEVISKYIEQSYEIAVGEQDNSLRLALNFKRQAAEVGEGGWFSIMGNLPIREVFQKAMALPDSMANLDIDKQKEIFEERAEQTLGITDLSELSDSAVMDKVISRYMILEEALAGPTSSTPGFTALTLLTGGSSGFGPAASASLFQSSF